MLNALYSALEQAKPVLGVDAVKAYKHERSSLLGGKGLRNMTIHEKHVAIDHSGYIPLDRYSLNFDLRKSPRLIQEARSASVGIVLNIGATHYIELDGKLVHVTDLFFKQFYELRQFLIKNGVVTQQGSPVDRPVAASQRPDGG